MAKAILISIQLSPDSLVSAVRTNDRKTVCYA